MGIGGATRETAGTLTLGAANTFTVADATESVHFIDDAWWTFTPTHAAVFTITTVPNFDDGLNFAVFKEGSNGDLTLVASDEFTDQTAYYRTPGGYTYFLVVGSYAGTPITYQVTYGSRPTSASEWIEDWQNNDENFTDISDIDGEDYIRPGSRRIGDVTYQETLGGPWGTAARDCAITHALWGNQFSALWADSCPPTFDGPADLEILGSSSVAHDFTDHTGLPFISDTAHMTVTTESFGIWLKRVQEILPPEGELPTPDPVDYGFPADSEVFWETDVVEVWAAFIADKAGTLGDDPDSRYAVNHSRQPSFFGGSWGAWSLGVLPGTPLPAPSWGDGPEDSSVTFASEGVDVEDKTWHPLDVPAGGFAELTQDYTNDAPDYTVIAGPAEAFGERALTADRSAPVSIMVRVYVRSPRFRFVTTDPLPTAVTRQWPRSPDARGLSAGTRIFPTPKSGRLFGGEQ